MTENSNVGWGALFLNGSVLDLDIGLWSAKTKILPSDFGISDSDEVKRALSLGTHRLFPKESFEEILSVVRDAKTATQYHSLPFPFVRGCGFR